MNNDFEKLQKAVIALYSSAYWTADRPVDSYKLWTDVRDAAGIKPGSSPKRIEPKRIPILFLIFPRLGKYCGY